MCAASRSFARRKTPTAASCELRSTCWYWTRSCSTSRPSRQWKTARIGEKNMSWTEAEATAHLRELFLKQLLPAAAEGGQLRAFFPLGGDAGAKTYYIERAKPRMGREDFLIRTADGGDDPIVALGELWKSQKFDK